MSTKRKKKPIYWRVIDGESRGKVCVLGSTWLYLDSAAEQNVILAVNRVN